MPDGCKKSRAQLLGEVQELRERIDELEAMASQNRRSAEIARPISASIPCVTYRCAPNKGHHTALAISDYVEQLTGYPASDFIDSAVRTWDSIVHRGDIENIDQLTKKAAELEEPWVVEYRIHCKDGSIRWVHERGMYVDDEDGVSKILEGVVLDVTERKEAEYRLWESERQSRAWLEFSPACTKIIDLDFNLQYMSNAGVKGLRIDDITPYYGKPYPLDFYPGSFRDQMISNLKKVKETGEIATQEGLVLDVEGNEMWFHSTLVPVNNDEGRIDYFISYPSTSPSESEPRSSESAWSGRCSTRRNSRAWVFFLVESPTISTIS